MVLMDLFDGVQVHVLGVTPQDPGDLQQIICASGYAAFARSGNSSVRAKQCDAECTTRLSRTTRTTRAGTPTTATTAPGKSTFFTTSTSSQPRSPDAPSTLIAMCIVGAVATLLCIVMGVGVKRAASRCGLATKRRKTQGFDLTRHRRAPTYGHIEGDDVMLLPHLSAQSVLDVISSSESDHVHSSPYASPCSHGGHLDGWDDRNSSNDGNSGNNGCDSSSFDQLKDPTPAQVAPRVHQGLYRQVPHHARPDQHEQQDQNNYLSRDLLQHLSHQQNQHQHQLHLIHGQHRYLQQHEARRQADLVHVYSGDQHAHETPTHTKAQHQQHARHQHQPEHAMVDTKLVHTDASDGTDVYGLPGRAVHQELVRGVMIPAVSLSSDTLSIGNLPVAFQGFDSEQARSTESVGMLYHQDAAHAEALPLPWAAHPRVGLGKPNIFRGPPCVHGPAVVSGLPFQHRVHMPGTSSTQMSTKFSPRMTSTSSPRTVSSPLCQPAARVPPPLSTPPPSHVMFDLPGDVTMEMFQRANKNRGWEDWVFALPAKQRNCLVRLINLTKAEEVTMKAEAQRRKQRLSHSLYKARRILAARRRASTKK